MHDFKNFPELSNRQMAIYYFESPHRQITEDFEGKVVKITDGDTIWVKWEHRKKPIVIRFLDTAAPERKEPGGKESASWLESKIMGEEVKVIVDPDKRIGKWGRILGVIMHMGMNINKQSIDEGMAIPFEERGKLWGSFERDMEPIKEWS